MTQMLRYPARPEGTHEVDLPLHSASAAPSSGVSALLKAAFFGALLVLGAPLASAQTITLPVTFEESIDYEFNDFGGNATTLVEDPEDASNTVARSVRAASAEFFAGTTVANATGFGAIPFADGATTMSVRVWSPAAGVPVRFKVEKFDDPTISVEAECPTTVAGGWQTIVYDFVTDKVPLTADINFANEYSKASIFYNFATPEAPPQPEQIFFWEDVAFGGMAVEGGCRNVGSGNTIADVRAADLGTEVTFSGVVTRAMGAFAYVQDATAGITIRQTSGAFFDDVANGTIAPGTQVTITGTTSAFRGLLQINGGDLASYTVDGVTGVPAAQPVTIAELAANGEAYEAELVEVSGLMTTETGVFAASTNYPVTDASGEGTMRVVGENDSAIDGTDIPGGAFTFTGVVGQFTFSDPATDGYQLLAIGAADIEADAVPVVSLPVDFESMIDYEFNDFGGNASTLVEDPTDASNTVVQSVRAGDAACFAGTTIASMAGFTEAIPFAMDATTMSVRVWSPAAGVRVLAKVEQLGEPGIAVETLAMTTMAGMWETLVFDFSNPMPNMAPINFDEDYNVFSIFFDFSCDLMPVPPAPPEATYFWDDVTFGGDVSGGGTIAEARAAELGTEVTFSGVVTRAMGDFTYVQDATAGITIRQTEGAFFDEVAAGTIAPGTQVTITGATSEFRGLFQINEGALTSYSVDGVTGVPAAQMITVAELLANGELYEAELVEVMGLTTAETGVFAERTNYTVTDGSGEGTLRVPNADDSMIDGTDIPTSPFTFTGVVGQFTFDVPAINGYQLLAIGAADITPMPEPVVTLPVQFGDGDEAYYGFNDFGGNASMLVTDPENAFNTVVQTVRASDAACFAGTTVANMLGFVDPIPFAEGATTMNLQVWSPEAGIRVLAKVEKVGAPEIFVETLATTTMAGAWDTLVFDFANPMPNMLPLNFEETYNKFSVFFDFSCDIMPPPPASPERTYLWDDIAFGSIPPVNTDDPANTLELELAQNFPNPFTGSTTIQFSLGTQDDVLLEVYNQLGQKVATLVEGRMEAGPHLVPFDASGLASGSYFYRLTHSGGTETRTMVLTR